MRHTRARCPCYDIHGQDARATIWAGRGAFEKALAACSGVYTPGYAFLRPFGAHIADCACTVLRAPDKMTLHSSGLFSRRPASGCIDDA